MSKLKIGDKVRIAKPEVTEGTCWIEGMECFISKVSEKEFISSNNASADLEDTVYGFPLSSLTLVEEADEQPTEQIAKEIDWEMRRWELAVRFYLELTVRTPQNAIGYADAFIEHYKQTLK